MINESNQYAGSIDKSTKQEWQRNGGPEPWIDDYDSFFQTLNEIITTTPSFSEAFMVSCPLNAFLAIAMGTKSGLILFHDETFNQQIKTVLDTWNAYLDSEASLDKLDIDNPEKKAHGYRKPVGKLVYGIKSSITKAYQAMVIIHGIHFLLADLFLTLVHFKETRTTI